MHIPDNYLSPQTCAAMTAVMVPAWAWASHRVRRDLKATDLPLLGMAAAFSFVIMMINIPLPGGTSGHAVGSVLIASLLGPWAALLTVSITLLLQALLFGDGGILSFATNCFNMAFLMPFAGWGLFRLFSIRAKSIPARAIALGIASWLAISLASLAAAVQFGIQPTLFHNDQGQAMYCPYGLDVTIPAMVLPHLLIAGLVEGLFTAGVWVFMQKAGTRELLPQVKRPFTALSMIVTLLVIAAPLGLLAAGTAWGEWDITELATMSLPGIAQGKIPDGFTNGFQFSALIPDYGIAGLPEIASYIMSAVIGVLILVISFRLLWPLFKRKTTENRETK